MKKLFFSLMTLLLAFTGLARAQELTVHDGSATNSYVPVYGFYADAYLKSEMVYPADELAELTGSNINSLKFYASQSDVSWGNANFQVFLTEVGSTSIDAFVGPANATVVYEGALSISNSEMYFEFSEPYLYGGGNLLIGVYNTVQGSYVSCTWYGEDAAGASVQGYSYSGLDAVSLSQRNFLPKTTFGYSGGAPVTCPKPTNLEFTLIPGNSSQVTLSWTENGDASQWQVCVDGNENNLITATTNPFTLTNVIPEVAHTAKVRAYCDANDQSAWSNTVTYETSDKLRIGSGTATNSYLPTYVYYSYSLTQQIYTAQEIGTSGAILGIDFQCNNARTRDLDIYMVNTDKESFSSQTDWISVTDADLVFSGEVEFVANNWTSITLANPFGYDGTSNLAIIVDDNTGSWESSASFLAFDGQSQAIRVYNDNTDYNPMTPSSYTGTVMNQKNQIRLDMATGPIVFHTITVVSNPEGAGVLTGGGNVLEGRSRTLTATPNYGYQFMNWTLNGAVVSTEPTYTFEVTEDATYTANFSVIPRYTVRVQANPLDGGYVTGGGTYLEHEMIMISAAPAEGFGFIGWEDDTHTIVAETADYTFEVMSNMTFTARFEVENIALIINDSVNELDLGPRPTGAWMRPFTATLTNSGATSHITSFESENPYFGIDLGDLSVPFSLEDGESIEFGITWGQAPNVTGPIQTNLTIDYENGDYTESQSWTLVGEAYNPIAGDVWETAIEVNGFPYSHNPGQNNHDNYYLPYPRVPDGPDVVFKLTFTEDTYLNAEAVMDGYTDGAPATKVALYQEGFQGLGGPDVSNNYTGPSSYVAPVTRDDDELTVYDGTTTNNHVPAYVFYFDDFTRSQYVIPADDLEDMRGGTINSLKFYTTSSNIPYTSVSDVDVYLMEVDYTTISAFEPKANGTIVYQGKLDFVSENAGGLLTIEFSTPYSYGGGNLLVGIDNTTDAGYKSIYFYGQNVTGASVSGSNGSGPDAVSANQQNFIPKTTFGYVAGNVDHNIHDMVVVPGTYYLVASAEADIENMLVHMEVANLTCPEVAYDPTPADSAMGVSDVGTTLKWKLGERTTQYCLRFGTDPDNLETLVDWTRDLQTQYTFADTLNFQTTYYWQVGERNDACPNGIFSDVWQFSTSMMAPTNLTAQPGSEILETALLTLVWDAPAEHRNAPLSYNVYRRYSTNEYELVGYTTETSLQVTGLQNLSTTQNYTTYTYAVTAVYEQGESSKSNTTLVTVYEEAWVQGYVYEMDSVTPVPNATVTFQSTGADYTCTTNSTGHYSVQLAARTYSNYSVYAIADGYVEAYLGTSFTAYTDSIILDANFYMREAYYPPVDVMAAYYPDANALNGDQVQVTWSVPGTETRDNSTAELAPMFMHGSRNATNATTEGDRGVQYYRVYRTAWDNWNYNEFNTVRVADNVTDLSAIDESFDTVAMGAYKYGVSCVYEGSNTRDEVYTETFDVAGIPTGWTTIDADGDGYNWMSSIDEMGGTGYGHNGSDGMMLSQSYINNVGALEPDNYLITPQMPLGGAFVFWACAQDASWSAEHFGVAVSTTNNTSASAFTTIQQWTIGSRDANPRPTQIRGGNRDQSEWVQYVVDLSAYEGQTGYVAIRHFDCTDQYFLNIDDVTTGGEAPVPFFLPTESEITWSNPIDKDMHLGGVGVNVTLHNGLSPEGTLVVLDQNSSQYEVNPFNETLEVTLDGTGSYTWDAFRKGHYFVHVYKPGYEQVNAAVDINNDTTMVFVLRETPVAASDLYVSRTGWATWNTGEMDTLSRYNNRSLMGSEVSLTSLDGSETLFSIQTSDKFIQLNTVNLEEYNIYRFNVKLMYTDTVSATVSVPWVYEPCMNFQGMNSVEGLVGPDGVNITWEYPELNPNQQRTEGTELWNTVFDFEATSAAQYGVASDGNYIYTNAWSSGYTYQFFKYDMDGNLIEGFNISGCGYLRDLTYDGRYFYGGANSSTLYCVDLANKRLVRTISTSVPEIRHCSYDPMYNGFWVGGWGSLYLINRAGTVQFIAPSPESCSGSGYYTDDDGVSHLYLFCQNDGGAKVYDYNIETNVISSDPIFDVAASLNDSGSSGGAFIGEYNGYTAFFADVQQDPNHIGIFALKANEINPAIPTGILGTIVLRNGEMIGFARESSFSDTLGTIENVYDLRVVYDGPRSCAVDNVSYSMSCLEEAPLEYVKYMVNATVNPQGFGTVEGVGEYDYTSTATLTAIANQGYRFVNWTLDGEVVGEEPIYSFQVMGPVELVANFELGEVEVTAVAVPEEGGIVEGTGTYIYGDSVTLVAIANEGYYFEGWAIDGEHVGEWYENEYTFIVEGDTEVEADFMVKDYYIYTEAYSDATDYGGGTTEGDGTYYYGDYATLTAIPNTGNHFVKWVRVYWDPQLEEEVEEDVSTEATFIFTVNDETAVFGDETLYKAYFDLNSYEITATAEPEDGGTIDGGGTYVYGDLISLAAIANEGYQFVNWTLESDETFIEEDNEIEVFVENDAHYIAHFELETYEVAVVAEPEEGGIVTGGDSYVYGDTVVLTAMAEEGYTFVYWVKNQQQVSVSPTYSFIMSEATAGTYFAVFTQNDYVVTAVASPEEGGTVIGGGPYNHGETCTLTATANVGYTFVNWIKDGVLFSVDETVSFLVTESATYVASFSENFYGISVEANPEEGGTVTGGGLYTYGTEVTLTATPNVGYEFDHWMKDFEDIEDYYEPTYTFFVEESASYIAVFKQNEYYPWFTIVPEDGGSATMVGGDEYGTFHYGDPITLVATPNEGYQFVNWMTEVWGDGEPEYVVISDEASYSFTLDSTFVGLPPFSDEIEFVANFELAPYEITVTAEPEEGGVVSGGGIYEYGQWIELTAVPNEGYQFLYWTLEGDPTLSFEDDVISVYVADSYHYIAHFSPLSMYISASANPETAGNIMGAGIYEYGESVTLIAEALEGYQFVNWTVNNMVVSTEATFTFVATEEAHYVANFELQSYEITASADPEAGGIVEGAGLYEYGSYTELTAIPNEGYEFAGWTLEGDSEFVEGDNYLNALVTGPAHYVAHFELMSYEVLALANPEDGGVVTGSGTYNYGETVTLTATPAEGYVFVNWMHWNQMQVSVSPTFSFTMTPDMEGEFYAVFSQNDYVVTAVANPIEGGYVEGTGSYNQGDVVNLIAWPAEGYHFVNWTLDGVEVSTETNYEITVTGNADYLANFEPNIYEITAEAMPAEGGVVTGAGEYAYGTSATLTATPAEGYQFVNWMLATGVVVSTEPNYTFTVTQDEAYVANFEVAEVTQPIALAQGWNWWSGYIDMVNFDALTALEEALGSNGEMIKSQNNGYNSYLEGFGWYGTLTQINNESSYQLRVNGNITIDLVGPAFVNPAGHEIALNHGWTWIGYPVSSSMSVEDAMSNINPLTDDMLKSQNDGFAAYLEGYGWYGALNTLNPGMGLMYKSNNNNEVTLLYPTPNAKGGLMANMRSDNNHWVPMLNAYPDNMSVMAVVEVNNEELRGENYELAAFAENGECRGSVRLLYVEPIDRYIAFLTVAGEDVTELYFSLYNTLTGEKLVGADENVNFSVNAVLGNFAEPYVVSFRGTTGVNEFGKVVNVYPNPVGRGQLLNLDMSVEGAVVRVEVVNALGALVSVETSTQLPASVKAPETAGVYTLRIITENNETFYRKFVVR